MEPIKSIDILIVDDEYEACSNLKNLIFEYVEPGLNIVGLAHNTKEAELMIKELSPAAVFLDIEMPNENAFDFLDRVMPLDFEVIFVTAYDEYAIRAFKLNAVDYILKPISISELRESVRKLKERLLYRHMLNQSSASYREIIRQVKDKKNNQKITFRDGSNIEIVEFKDIILIEANGSYSKVLYRKDNRMKNAIMSTSLVEYEELLPDNTFYRIHKSYIINCVFIRQILKGDTSQVFLTFEITLPISRRRFVPLLEFLKSNDFRYE